LEVQGLSKSSMLTEKLVTSACCEKQHAHAYLQPFSRKTDQQRKNNDFYGGTTLWCPSAKVSLNLENRDLEVEIHVQCWKFHA